MIFYLFITVIFLYNFFLWYNRNQKYWALGIKGPYNFPIIGNMLSVMFRTFAQYEANNLKNYGPVYYDFILDANGVITFNDPEIVKRILIKDFHCFQHRLQPEYMHKFAEKAVIFQNESWKRIRTQVTPVFSSGKLRIMYKNFQRPISVCLDNIDELIKTNKSKSVDVQHLTKCFALDIISNTVFSLQTNTFKEDVEFSKKVSDLFVVSRFMIFLFIVLPKSVQKYIELTFLQKEATVYFSKLALKLIEERKQNKDKSIVYNDFIELLLKSEAEGKVESDTREDGHINKKLTLEEIVGQCFIFFVAGIETVHTMLSVLMWELAVNQNVQDKLYKDLIDCYPNEEIEYDDLNKSKYLDCVLNEALRKHTTLNRIFRQATVNYDFGNGLKIKKGQTVGVSLYNLHNDHRNYKEPEKFRPERFERNEVDTSLPVFIPFVDGPRNCIGNRYAQVEIKALMIKLLKKYRVYATAKTDIPLRVRKAVILNQVKDINLAFEYRR